MSEVRVLKLLAREVDDFSNRGQAGLGGKLARQFLGHHVHFAARFKRNVFFEAMESDGHRSGQGLGGSGPDDGKNLLTFQSRIDSSAISRTRIPNPHATAGGVLLVA